MASESSKPSPYLRANIWSRFFHSWITKLLREHRRKGTIDLEDLYDVPLNLEANRLTKTLENNWFDEIKRRPNNPSLVRVTLLTTGWKLFFIGLLLIPSSLLSISQPLVLSYLMTFFEPCSTMPIWKASLLALTTVSIALVTKNQYVVEFFQNIYLTLIHSMSMRIAYSGLIYRKALRLSSHSINLLSSGKIVNLLSNDAGQIEYALMHGNSLWKTPIELIFVIIFYWKSIRYLMFIAIGYALVLLFVQAGCSRLILVFRTRILKITDERVKIMSEIIKSMRIVKMFCWESAFSKKVSQIRKREILQCSFRLFLDCIQTLLSHTFNNVTFLLIYTILWKFRLQFDIQFFAITMCMNNHLRNNVVHHFTIGIRNFVNYMAAQKRIQKYLLLDETERDNRLLSTSYLDILTESNLKENKNIKEQSLGLNCKINRAYWQKDARFQLKNIVFNGQPGDLICIIGPVGSGKSSLLQTLSGEITYFEGKIRLYKSFCYVPQEPWIFSSTIKNNILFGKEYDQNLFERVIHASALRTDIDQWSNGINTLVGDQGVMLSGGQKARINMARALYRDADIYLMDDPLSAVDVKVSKHLFQKSIKEHLNKKICILATHQIQFLQDANLIIVLNNGEVTHCDKYEELIKSSFVDLLGNISQQESDEKQTNVFEKQKSLRENKNDLINIEKKQEGMIKWHVYTSYLRSSVNLYFGLIVLIGIFSVREYISIFSDRWLSKWSYEQTYEYEIVKRCEKKFNHSIEYFNDQDNSRYYIYLLSVFVLLLVTFIRVSITEFLFLNAGRVLHNRMFYRFIRAPIHFFDTNPIGRMSNRFTKDMAILDDYLPITLFEFFQCLGKVLGTVLLVSYLNPWSFLPALISLMGMIFIRHCFASCLRDLKRIEGITRSPIYSYLTSTINGLKVIRSYHAEEFCSNEFLIDLNNNTRVNYLLCVVNRWAAIRFDWITVFFISLVTLLAMYGKIFGKNLSSDDMALMMTYSLLLMGTLQWTIRLSVDVESQMTAVERILEYCSLDQEPNREVSIDRRPPSTWPSNGEIIYENVSMSYSDDDNGHLALENISMNIRSQEKIGIVGRTGAGKSSLIQTLFRMGNLLQGKIQIDQIDISTIGLDDLRSRLSIIPQDPVLFTGTIRSNLDPFDQFTDQQIWLALEQVQLKQFISQTMTNNLQSIVIEGGGNLSVGQKQLLCLARMILKQTKIIIIDEATANVDNATDHLIQQTIREQFRDSTVLTVAHRLRTIIDNDRILVLGNGRILEFDTPIALLSNSNSYFTQLVQQTGRGESKYLRTLAHISTEIINSDDESATETDSLLCSK